MVSNTKASKRPGEAGSQGDVAAAAGGSTSPAAKKQKLEQQQPKSAGGSAAKKKGQQGAGAQGAGDGNKDDMVIDLTGEYVPKDAAQAAKDLVNAVKDGKDKDGKDGGKISGKSILAQLQRAQQVAQNAQGVQLFTPGTGPMSVWENWARPHEGSKAQSNQLDSGRLSSANFRAPNLRPLSGFGGEKLKRGEPVPFQLLTEALTIIEDSLGSGKGSNKFKILVLTNLFRAILYYNHEDLISTIWYLISKVAPDYEGVEVGVGDQLVLKAVAGKLLIAKRNQIAERIEGD